MKITEILDSRMSFSFEVFPPKTDAGMEKLRSMLQYYYNYKPDFISCTYGAGGSNAGRNVEVCQAIIDDGVTEVMTHFTCIGNAKAKINSELGHYRSMGIENILAMRGDLPAGWEGTQGDFSYADGLIRYIKREFPDFCIAAACYPEKHILAPSFAADIAHLRSKQDNGAEFLMSQLCHDVEAFKEFVYRIRDAGITAPVVLGIMPALDKDAIIRMTVSNGCSIPAELAAIIGRYGEDPDEFKKAGIEYTINQIYRFMEAGIEGLHIYTLNKWEDVETIMDGCGIRKDV
ncbi:MAG: 5,10-methylenetetrahydrofolate reductase [Actinobacteria bacterium]|nr:5,10-methylenetetrahydrofolate reductase [Actinomycetota bacterium]